MEILMLCKKEANRAIRAQNNGKHVQLQVVL